MNHIEELLKGIKDSDEKIEIALALLGNLEGYFYTDDVVDIELETILKFLKADLLIVRGEYANNLWKLCKKI